ncbi:HesA/MoeB/ThiF family protein [Palleronia caenipelagi]|uniref:HesA/MoeB/ThiF family protein n=1 Tax=Palleronia caenipelagi TaxID=2489174 RepID=A0A547Q773_9RHOB|nr:HesA/MoeB/ThiF family protein [Palleronia caenipelagi]TRD22235.1 HesA/MoeB/ThiF family protein [Palleronia caenipelagi]
MEDKDLLRYSRHILLGEIDIAGQERIMASHVLIIGAGGLGSPVALYLASAGVGRLTICDGDLVDLTNLQRQILHRETRIGQNKALSAQTELAGINPGCEVRSVTQRVGPEELGRLIAEADVVVDASDNFTTRHAVNRACAAACKPNVVGMAIRFAGQITVFDTRDAASPCYACFLPEDAAVEEDRCAATGVLASLTGTIGSMQATEALNILNFGSSALVGRVLLYDSLSAEWQAAPIPRQPSCPICGSR